MAVIDRRLRQSIQRRAIGSFRTFRYRTWWAGLRLDPAISADLEAFVELPLRCRGPPFLAQHLGRQVLGAGLARANGRLKAKFFGTLPFRPRSTTALRERALRERSDRIAEQ
jgi:hypothetical protein